MVPRRVLVLSAPVGEGHVAAARALAARMRARWPDARVDEHETVGGGAWRTRFLATTYALVMRWAPRLYGLGYDLLVRFPRASAFFQRRSARATGRRLAPLLDDASDQNGGPDLVVSTYPLASGGLAWLRRAGRLPGRAIAVVTDAAVHPFWVWPELDETWTLFPGSRTQALRWAPDAVVRLAPAAVDARFVPGDRSAARIAHSLPVDGAVVVVAGGSLGFGPISEVVDAVLGADPEVRVVALCGRHDALAARLRDRPEARGDRARGDRARDGGARDDGPRLVVHGWTDRVPTLLTAADWVVTTGGGVMATEALAVGRPVVFAAPVPGHGRAGAAVMVEAGVAAVAWRPADVGELVRRLRPGSQQLASLAAAAEAYGRADLTAALDDLADRIRGVRT